MREQIKQALKNSVYRAIGETASGLGAVDGDDRSLRVLMYHKVNDLAGNRMSMPVSLFDEQMAELRELGYTVVDLDAVLAHYVDGAPLPPGAVLITFDDGYRDNLENAAPVLHRHGYAAVQFVPLAYVGDRQPLPHEEHLARGGIVNRTVDWEELGELERLACGSSRTASATGRSPTSSSTRRRARSPSPSCGSRSGSDVPCARSRTSRAPRRTTSRCT